MLKIINPNKRSKSCEIQDHPNSWQLKRSWEIEDIRITFESVDGKQILLANALAALSRLTFIINKAAEEDHPASDRG